MREYLEYLLRDDNLESDRKVYTMIRMIDHLKLTFELVADTLGSKESSKNQIIELLFLDHYIHTIKQITRIARTLDRQLGINQSYRNFRNRLSKCQERIKARGIDKMIANLSEKIS
jgi:hypothetical protein